LDKINKAKPNTQTQLEPIEIEENSNEARNATTHTQIHLWTLFWTVQEQSISLNRIK